MPEERAPATHFVSSARATLSPVPGRKVFNLASAAQEEKEVEVEKKEEVHRKLSTMQSKVEEDLRRQVCGDKMMMIVLMFVMLVWM